jgi:hypothetical protein
VDRRYSDRRRRKGNGRTGIVHEPSSPSSRQNLFRTSSRAEPDPLADELFEVRLSGREGGLATCSGEEGETIA